jgi:hypothetical protein
MVRRGASSKGCLLSLLIFVAALYYGVNIGEVYFRYYRMVDEMQTQARLASALDDATIERRLQVAVQQIGLPDAARQIRVVRRISPREIQIYTQYSETVDLPLFHHTFQLRPSVTQPL